jgi:DNA-binding winged helix-turn-helix (wHTH) protein
VVSKEELLDEVWGDRFVSESALTRRLKDARKAVGDDGSRQDVILTVHGRGYRFVASVSEEVGPAPSAPATSRSTPATPATPAPDLGGTSPDTAVLSPRRSGEVGDSRTWPLLGRAE